MARETIETSNAPSAIGPYSQGVKVGNLLFTAGQIPIDPATGKLVEGDIQAQAERVLLNLTGVVEAAGGSLASVVKTTCFLMDMNDFTAFNEVYARHFGENRPARSTVQVAKLPAGSLVEVECVAEIG